MTLFFAGKKIRASQFGRLATTAEFQMSGDQSIATGTDTTILFDTDLITSTLVTKGTTGSGSKFTIGEGLWVISTSIRHAAAANGGREAHIGIVGGNRLAQAEAPGSSAHATGWTLTTAPKYFTAGTEIEVQAWQNSGGANDVEAVAAFAIGKVSLTRIFGP